MAFPVPDHLPTPPEPPALVRVATREDVQWSRPIFKAPPLDQLFGNFDATTFTEEFRRVGLGPR